MAREKVCETREWLKEMRKEKGLTVRAVAKEIGLSWTHYSDIENGRRNPSLKMAVKISHFYEINVEKLA